MNTVDQPNPIQVQASTQMRLGLWQKMAAMVLAIVQGELNDDGQRGIVRHMIDLFPQLTNYLTPQGLDALHDLLLKNEPSHPILQPVTEIVKKARKR